ncbi:cholinesterase-like isoform X1 [Clavelina lepadiformis]|uniref:cholinesterase-like isoform X1 n=1 Tax=Clavelina lepadiformis TaxID=159417 RepID=UPI0040436B51
MMFYKFSVVFAVAISLISAHDAQPRVSTSYGEVMGKHLTVGVNGEPRHVDAYLGIRFAVAPLRFSGPEDPLPWKQVLNATEFGPTCFHQDDEFFPGFPGAEMWNAPNRKSEDCLHLNVWTPANSGQERLAVMVWVYGGSFFSGTSALSVYDGRYLSAAGNVVVVSFNYRLGPLGFLPPLDESAPGNVGMLDQQWAFKWVRDNIHAFGGNADNVTLFGESAGAASISLHTLAPSSRGLFNRVILQSGNAMTPWSAVSLETALERTKTLATSLSCSTTNYTSMLACLRSQDVDDLFSASWITSEIFDFPFVPVYGTNFLPEHPHEMVVNRKHDEIDMLLGFNSNEGSYFNIYSISGFNISTESLITRRQYTSGMRLCGLRTNALGRWAASFMYSDWENPSNPAQYRDALDEIVDHFHIRCPTMKMSKLHSEIAKNVFTYHFSYRLSTNPWPQWAGVMHGYEIELVFGLPMFGDFPYARGYNDRDRDVSTRMVRYWTNFAKFGNPNGPVRSTKKKANLLWPAFDEKFQNYVEIAPESDIVRSPAPQAFYCAFWELYLPYIQNATDDLSKGDNDEADVLWRMEFRRWAESMESWNRAFRNYSDDE